MGEATPTFREVPGDDRGFVGATILKLPDGRERWMLGVGVEVRERLVEARDG